MTTEEKAKAYDEALERARKLYNDAKANEYKSDMEDYESIFPELAENEDERIMSRIIDGFKNFSRSASKWNNIPIEEVIAYLEKKKKQKPETRVKIPKFRVGDIIQHIPIEKWDSSKKIVSIDECGYNYNLSHLGDTVSGGAIGFAFENEYELVEQKQVDYEAELKKCKDNPLYFYDKYVSIKQKSEWSESDKQNINLIISYLDSYIEEHNDTFGADECKSLKYWLKSLPLNLKKKNEDVAKLCSNEWSEEDEKLFWGFTAYVPEEELKRLGVTRNDILKKLKSIRPQPIQIKEAYKEGFQTARHATALAFMKYCDKIRPNEKMCLFNGEYEEIEKAFLVGDWEKIERYFHKCQWRPSEEQMEAFEKAATFFKTKWTETKVKEQLALVSLYNDLNVLIEEE